MARAAHATHKIVIISNNSPKTFLLRALRARSYTPPGCNLRLLLCLSNRRLENSARAARGARKFLEIIRPIIKKYVMHRSVCRTTRHDQQTARTMQPRARHAVGNFATSRRRSGAADRGGLAAE